MGTATAPSTTLPAGKGLAGREGLPLPNGVRPRSEGRLKSSFDIAQRGAREGLPRRDANRVGAMRRIARAFLAYHRLDAMEFVVSLIVSELVTNAIVHSRGTKVDFTMTFRDGELHIAVRNDGMSVCTPDRAASDDAEHGRGLQLVASMVHELGGTWGVESDRHTVSCNLPATGEAQ
ncbi:ATP-binding protein [Streptomyces sp. NPDC016172]|uniref:ATP-binding protein n=1 Tax=Streptomyces sp. NPDC016172 TaxID=3364964 RepID=UPI0036F4EA3B